MGEIKQSSSQHQNLSKILDQGLLPNSLVDPLSNSQKASKDTGSLLNSDIYLGYSQRNTMTATPPTFVDMDLLNPEEPKKDSRRTKERKICDIVESVTLWRKLYNGIPDNKGHLLRYSLDDAAKKVGVSKKSLDDYLLQIRLGKRYGFDFEKHKHDRVGVLRKFVKKCKAQDQK